MCRNSPMTSLSSGPNHVRSSSTSGGQKSISTASEVTAQIRLTEMTFDLWFQEHRTILVESKMRFHEILTGNVFIWFFCLRKSVTESKLHYEHVTGALTLCRYFSTVYLSTFHHPAFFY